MCAVQRARHLRDRARIGGRAPAAHRPGTRSLPAPANTSHKLTSRPAARRRRTPAAVPPAAGPAGQSIGAHLPPRIGMPRKGAGAETGRIEQHQVGRRDRWMQGVGDHRMLPPAARPRQVLREAPHPVQPSGRHSPRVPRDVPARSTFRPARRTHRRRVMPGSTPANAATSACAGSCTMNAPSANPGTSAGLAAPG